jgi:putative addiction module component (TIGR02574 family)
MSTKLKIPPEFDALPSDERIAYVQELWDRIAQAPSRLPISDEHKRILDERLDAYEANPEPGRPWGEVRDDILKKLRSS